MSELRTPAGLEIRGIAGAYEAVVIAAVVSRLLEEEEAARAVQPHRPDLPAWVRAGRAAPPPRPLWPASTPNS